MMFTPKIRALGNPYSLILISIAILYIVGIAVILKYLL